MRCADHNGCPLAATCAHTAPNATGAAALLNGQRQALGVCLDYDPIAGGSRMRDRLNAIDSLRAAHDECVALRETVAEICRRNPHGLQLKPLFSVPKAPRKVRGAASVVALRPASA